MIPLRHENWFFLSVLFLEDDVDFPMDDDEDDDMDEVTGADTAAAGAGVPITREGTTRAGAALGSRRT